MKLFKKLMAVVALAAICVTMTAPMSASAALPGGCKHVMETKEVYRVVLSSERVTFYYLADVDDDGMEEIVVDVCEEITYEVQYKEECAKCGYGILAVPIEEFIHSAGELCPNY